MTILTEEKLGILDKLASTCVELQLPYAIWKKPGQTKIYYCNSFHGLTIPEKFNPETSPEGFAISPFYNPDSDQTYFLSADLLITDFNSDEVQKKITDDKFREKFSTISNLKFNFYSPEKIINNTNQKEYCELVEKGIDAIKNNDFKKIVLARGKSININTKNVIDLFYKLATAFPNAFVALFSSPETGTWIGASPEILMCADEKEFRTMSLAGTQRSPESQPLAEIVWSQKEIEEQALVTRYIVNCFKKIRLREYEEEGPRTVKIGNLAHLKTDFVVKMEKADAPNVTAAMLPLLHPTSAVCGMPKEPAMEFIMMNEPFSREFYSGYLGPINIEGSTDIFVNLRCAQVFKNKIFLYAGAGITQDSVAEKEWEETELKMNVIQQFLS